MSFDEFMRKLLFLPQAATDFADTIDHLHFFVISVTFIGSAVVGFLAVWWLVRFRRRGKPHKTPHVTGPSWFEPVWIGGLLSLFILWWVIGFRQYISYATPPVGPGVTDIYVTAKQWMWKFEQPNGRASMGVLVVPKGRAVRLIMTSRDVVHSFYVPAFRLKRDVLPGRYTSVWFNAREAGVYDVHCAEYCGTGHSRMWAAVAVLDPEDYETWQNGEEPELVARAGTRVRLEGGRVGEMTGEKMPDRGRKAATAHACFSCHTVDGQPHIGPTWQGLYGKRVELENGETLRADEAYLTRSMMDPLAHVVRGFDPVMPTYQGKLAMADAAAIVEYIKTLHEAGIEPAVALPETKVEPRDGGTE